MKQGKKQAVKQEVVNDSNEDKLKKAFELFDENGNGKMNAKEIREAMLNIGYEEKNPVNFNIASELDTPSNDKNGGASFEDFVTVVNEKIPSKETDEQLRKVYNLFLENPNDSTTSLSSIKRVADELGVTLEEDELKSMLKKSSKAGAELTFEDFVDIMRTNP